MIASRPMRSLFDSLRAQTGGSSPSDTTPCHTPSSFQTKRTQFSFDMSTTSVFCRELRGCANSKSARTLAFEIHHVPTKNAPEAVLQIRSDGARLLINGRVALNLVAQNFLMNSS